MGHHVASHMGAAARPRCPVPRVSPRADGSQGKAGGALGFPRAGGHLPPPPIYINPQPLGSFIHLPPSLHSSLTPMFGAGPAS
jgi:hypothetical protein